MFKLIKWLTFNMVPTFYIFAGLAMQGEKEAITGAERELLAGYTEEKEFLDKREEGAIDRWGEERQAGMAGYDPYIEAGKRGLEGYSNLVNQGLSPEEMESDPSYRFRLQQGQQAQERTASRMGNRFSGNLAMGLAKYNQDMASQEYSNIYQRKYTGLQDLANMGYTAMQGQTNYSKDMYGAREGLDRYYGGAQRDNIMGRAGTKSAATYGRDMAGARMFAGIHKDMASMAMSFATKGQANQSAGTDTGGGSGSGYSPGGGGSGGGYQGGGGQMDTSSWGTWGGV